MDIGEKIKAFRLKKDLSQKDVALAVGIDRAQYSRIENGKVEPTISSLKKIANALGIQLVDIFKKEDSLEVNSFDKSFVDKMKLIDELDEIEKKSIFHIVDGLVSKKRLKDTLADALKKTT